MKIIMFLTVKEIRFILENMNKTIKLKSDEFFELKNVDHIPNFLIGGRGTGKSYTVKKYIKEMILNSNFEIKYLYVRISHKEIKTHDGWLRESGILDSLPFENDNAEIRRGKPSAGRVSITYNTVLGVESKHIGYVASLETSSTEKSDVFDDVGCIVFEEFIRRGLSQKQIEEYTFNFMELIETTMRNRKIPIFFIANTLNAYNPLLSLFKKYNIYKIFSENRRDNIVEGKFADYLRGELYTTSNYNIDDFNYLTTIKTKGDKYFSIYCDKYYFRDILITNKNNTSQGRIDLLYLLKREFMYNFSTMNFIFDSEKTEVYFYTNIETMKLKIRNKLTSLIN